MKHFLELLFLLVFILSALSYAAAQDRFEEAEREIEEEFKWLQAEAGAEIVTVATKTKMTVQEAPSVVSVITAEEIRNMGARDITDVLRTIPGFDLTHGIAFPVTQINIRGMTSTIENNKIRIMINGHSIQAKDGGASLHIDMLPIASIRKIEIIRGPGSALYGTRAFLGVINIITKKGGDEPSRISAELGSFDTLKAYGEFSHKKGDFEAYLYADCYTTDGYDGKIGADAATDSYIFAPSASREMTGDAKYYTLQTDISYDKLYFSGFFQKLDTNNPIGIAKVLTDENSLEFSYAYGEFGYKDRIRDRGNLLLRMYYDYGDHTMNWEIFTEETAALDMHTGFPQDESPRSIATSTESVLGGEIMADHEICPGIRLTAGASYEHVRLYDTKHFANHNVTGEMLSIGGKKYPPFPFEYFPGGMTDISEDGNWIREADRDIFALYGQGIADLKKLFSLEKGVKSLYLTAGLRYDHYDDVGSSVTPRLGLVWTPVEKLFFKILYGEAFRAPSFEEMYIRNTSTLVGNEDLKPENVTTVEGVVGYNFTENIRGSITCFDIRAEDMILPVSRENDDHHIYEENVGKTRANGVESELKLTFGKNRYAYANFTWQDVKNTTNAIIGGTDQRQEDFHPGGVPEFYGNIGLNYDITENIIANVSLNYVGKRNRSEEKMWDGEKLIQTDQRDPIKACTLVNSSLTFRNLIRGLEIQLSGFNLFNADHRVPDPEGFIRDDMPRPGRTFMGRVSYLF